LIDSGDSSDGRSQKNLQRIRCNGADVNIPAVEESQFLNRSYFVFCGQMRVSSWFIDGFATIGVAFFGTFWSILAFCGTLTAP
jgi:hypothetical protein